MSSKLIKMTNSRKHHLLILMKNQITFNNEGIHIHLKILMSFTTDINIVHRHLEMYEKSQRERAAQQQDVGDGLGLPKPPTTQAKYSISSMVRSSNTAMPNQTRGFALPTLFQIPGQNGPNVGNSGPTSNFTPSAGIDICTLMTIAPSGNMPNYGYSSL